jgi:hypothetical protein
MSTYYQNHLALQLRLDISLDNTGTLGQYYCRSRVSMLDWRLFTSAEEAQRFVDERNGSLPEYSAGQISDGTVGTTQSTTRWNYVPPFMNE